MPYAILRTFSYINIRHELWQTEHLLHFDSLCFSNSVNKIVFTQAKLIDFYQFVPLSIAA